MSSEFSTVDEALTHLKTKHSNTGFLEAGWGEVWFGLEPATGRLRELNELHHLLHNPLSGDGQPGPERLANMFKLG